MINDLQLAGDGRVNCKSQVCIIGAGTAGLFLANLLREQGLQVVVLEAGNSVARSCAEMNQRCRQLGQYYRGADVGRSFGLGGTSALWGGQMIPMTESDLGARSEAGIKAWPINYSQIAKYFDVVRQHIGLDAGTFSVEGKADDLPKRAFPDLYNLDPNLNLRVSEWLPFAKRNFAQAFSGWFTKDAGVIIWLNAAVTGMSRSSPGCDAQIEMITAQSANGHALHVQASVVVICAGALESTRLLLAFDESTQGSITNEGAPLGRYFSDHLSVSSGRFICRDWHQYNLSVAPVFRNGVMYSPRLELASAAQRKLRLTSAFAHMTFVTIGDTGFDVVRNILRRRQGENLSRGMNPMVLGDVIGDLSQMAYWRGVHRRLWIPRRATLLLQVDIEQAPNPESRLYLSSERDALNRKTLIVDWRISPSDIRTIRETTKIVVATWQRSALAQLAELHAVLQEEAESFDNLYDVYHPAGTLRMGSSPANSIVDQDLCMWSARNCYVTTTAVFPSSGSANPGMTHLALTARLADKIVRRVLS